MCVWDPKRILQNLYPPLTANKSSGILLWEGPSCSYRQKAEQWGPVQGQFGRQDYQHLPFMVLEIRPSRMGPDFSISCQRGENCISKGPKTIRLKSHLHLGNRTAMISPAAGQGGGPPPKHTQWSSYLSPPLQHLYLDSFSKEKAWLDLGLVNDSYYQSGTKFSPLAQGLK